MWLDIQKHMNSEVDIPTARRTFGISLVGVECSPTKAGTFNLRRASYFNGAERGVLRTGVAKARNGANVAQQGGVVSNKNDYIFGG